MRFLKVFCTCIIASCLATGQDTAELPPSKCIQGLRYLLYRIRTEVQEDVDECFTKAASISVETFDSRENGTIKVAYADISVIDDTIANENQRKISGSAFLVYPTAPLSINDVIREYCHRNITKELCTSLIILRLQFNRSLEIANHYKDKINGKTCGRNFQDIPYPIKGLLATLKLDNSCSQTLSYPRFSILIQDHGSDHLKIYAAYQLMTEWITINTVN